MMSSIVNVVLFVALLLTTASVVQMYRKLTKLDRLHTDYERILSETATSLDAARTAVTAFHLEARDTVAELGREIEVARRLIAEIDARSAAAARPAGEQSAAPP